MRKSYNTVSLPNELLKEVDKVVKKSKLSYSSRAEFIKEAVRAKVKQETK